MSTEATPEVPSEEPTAAVENETTTATNDINGISKTPSSDSSAINPALEEPDTMSIVQKGQAAIPTVTQHRKEELLLQARAERRKWVQTIPLPYATARDPNNLWSLDDRLYPVQSSLACQRMSSVTKVLSELYGLETDRQTPEQVAQRVADLVQPLTSDEPIIEQNEEQLAEALLKDDSESLRAYHDFWKTLLKPECALLIQGMRNFLGNMEGADMDRMQGAFRSYIDSTVESLKSHLAWKDRPDIDFALVKQSLESFFFGQAQHVLEKLEWKGLFNMSEEDWTDRLKKLQFVKANHLEIACLDGNTTPEEELLEGPIRAILSIDQYYSPYEKLQRILAVYKEINSSLSNALNSDNPDGDRKLPSADDVLPSIILAVLKAKPVNMFRNLQFIEVFAPQEYLRGEAGYAYTNLYGAVQFLQDLNMEQPDSLSITPEEFRKGLSESVSNVQKRLSITPGDGEEDSTEKTETLSADISVQDVREARLRGQPVDLEWAVQHQKENPEKYGLETNAPTVAALPEGFNRNYSFLSATPQDIRLSDLPKLLSEYKALVHVTEQLLGERAARFATEKKKRAAEKSQQLDDSFFGISTPSPRERTLTS